MTAEGWVPIELGFNTKKQHHLTKQYLIVHNKTRLWDFELIFRNVIVSYQTVDPGEAFCLAFPRIHECKWPF